MIDYSVDQIIKPSKLKRLYKQNDNKINTTLYRKYWTLSQIYPKEQEISKRRDILHEVLTEYAHRFEKIRQAENEVWTNKQESSKKNGDENNGTS